MYRVIRAISLLLLTLGVIDGVMAAEPTVGPSNAKVTNIQCKQATINWTNGNGGWRLVLVKEGSAVDATPSDGSSYTVFNTFGSGQQLGTGNYAVYNNITSSFTLLGLKANTKYYIAIYEHDGGSPIDYLTSSPATVSFTTYDIKLDFDFTIDDSCDQTNVVTFNNKTTSNFSGIKFTWLFQDGNQDTGKNVKHTYMQGGNYQVMLVASPSYGCTDNFTNTNAVKIIPRPVSVPVEVNNRLSQCLEGNLFSFADNTTLKNLPKMAYTRTWYFTPTDSSTIPKPVKTFTKGGKYKILYKSETYFDNVRTGCTDTASLWINVVPSPSSGISINDSLQCLTGNNFVFDNIFPGLVKFSWDLGDGTSSVNKSITHSYAAPGVYPIIHSAESPEGCKSKDTVLVAVKPNVVATFAGLPAIACENDAPITLFPSNPDGIFYPSSGSVSGTLYTPGNAGNHSIKYVVKDSFCPDSVTQNIKINLRPKFTLGKDTVICDNQDFLLVVNTPGNIAWENGTSANPRSIFNPGKYSATVTNNGCSWSDTINVGYALTPQADLPGDTLICKGALIVLKQTWPKSTINWSTGSRDSVIYVSSPGVYSVAVTNACGTASDWMEVKVSDGECDIFIPTAFTPNGDDRNEYFEIVGRDITPTLLIIYNRWGEVLFDSNKSGEYKWYGDANGEPCISGLYPFLYRYEQRVGDRVIRKTVSSSIMILK